MTDRIKSLIAHLGLSTRAFALNCGLRQNTLSNQLNGNREISISTIMAILNAYPDVSSDWLVRGVGKMFIEEETDANMGKLLSLVDTINTLQATINDKSDTIKDLTARIKELESQLKQHNVAI